MNTQKMRLRPELCCKRISGVFRAQGTCLAAANVVSPVRGASSASLNPLAEFEKPCTSNRGKRGKGKKGKRERDGRTPPPK